jgi:GNAT superfamily N-acetyltransferase
VPPRCIRCILLGQLYPQLLPTERLRWSHIGWLQVSETDEEIFLKQMFLQPTAQRKGIGSQLLADLISHGQQANKPVRLGVVKINPAVSVNARFSRH